MRVLACTDAVPAADGSCAQTAYLEQPSLFPEITTAQLYELGTAILGVLVWAYVWKHLPRVVRQ